MANKGTDNTQAAAVASLAAAPQRNVVPAVAPHPSPDKARFEIRTPGNPMFNGVRAGVAFRDGVGHTDDDEAADHCASCGYVVTDRRAKAAEKK